MTHLGTFDRIFDINLLTLLTKLYFDILGFI